VRREQLQHVILEIGERFGLTEFYVIGSAAILAAAPNPERAELVATRDVDVLPIVDDPRLSDQISFVIGEGSAFDEEHGYYAQGVDHRTARFAPSGWQQRAIAVTAGRYRALCMEPHDLVLSKLGAGRDKDLQFARAAAEAGLVHVPVLRQRLANIAASEEERRVIELRVNALER
jgi:hypothetical protein